MHGQIHTCTHTWTARKTACLPWLIADKGIKMSESCWWTLASIQGTYSYLQSYMHVAWITQNKDTDYRDQVTVSTAIHCWYWSASCANKVHNNSWKLYTTPKFSGITNTHTHCMLKGMQMHIHGLQNHLKWFISSIHFENQHEISYYLSIIITWTGRLNWREWW